jgi:SSS family solute:Na+ symporter
MPGLLKTIFFARALRTSISVVAVCMFFLPFFSSGAGAFWGLLLATVTATVWFVLGNPFGIDNIYIALAVPVIIMVIDHFAGGQSSRPAEARQARGTGAP